MTRVFDRATLIAVSALVAVLGTGPGARAADPAAEAAHGYTLEASAAPSTLKVGDGGTLAVVIRPKVPTWHVHPQAPVKVRFAAPAGLKLERADLGRKDVADPKAEAPRFETRFVAAAAGKQEVRADVDFFICSDTACVKQVKSVQLPVDVR